SFGLSKVTIQHEITLRRQFAAVREPALPTGETVTVVTPAARWRRRFPAGMAAVSATIRCAPRLSGAKRAQPRFSHRERQERKGKTQFNRRPNRVASRHRPP